MGHIVSKDGIETDPKNVTAIKEWLVPKTVTEVQSFLGLLINQLVVGENANKKKSSVEWIVECQQAFEHLKQLCSQTPMLAYANYKKAFKLHTDASESRLGAVLYQKQDDGTDCVIAYASQTLSKSERNYDAHKLEFFALTWSVTERFHEYPYGGHFEVYMDNNPLTYILTTAKLDATRQRWVASLANYNFKTFLHEWKTQCRSRCLIPNTMGKHMSRLHGTFDWKNYVTIKTGN